MGCGQKTPKTKDDQNRIYNRNCSARLSSEIELQSKLHPSRIVDRGQDSPQIGIVNVPASRFKARPVEDVERFPAEINSFVFADVERFRQRIVFAEVRERSSLGILSGGIP